MRTRTSVPARTSAGVHGVATAAGRDPGFLGSFRTLPRMLRAMRRGEYRPATPRILLGLATLGYVVSPVDVLPEALLGPLGAADDATLAVTAFTALLAAETASFLEWEHGRAMASEPVE